MLSRARRVAACQVTRFQWPALNGAPAPMALVPQPLTESPPAAEPDPAAAERDAFAKGYEQGERAGADAGRARVDAMLGRLANTIEELARLRRSVLAESERQLVQLALAIATRVLRREVAPDLAVEAARHALERLGPGRQATIRLHPEDWAAAAETRATDWAGDGVIVLADSVVARGGCRVESEAGFVDAGVDAQIAELSRALLDETSPVAVAARHGA